MFCIKICFLNPEPVGAKNFYLEPEPKKKRAGAEEKNIWSWSRGKKWLGSASLVVVLRNCSNKFFPFLQLFKLVPLYNFTRASILFKRMQRSRVLLCSFQKNETFLRSFAFFIKRTKRFLRSFTFFIKEPCVLCTFLRSL